MYTLKFSHTASKALLRMPRNLATLIRSKLDSLANDPHALQNNIRHYRKIGVSPSRHAASKGISDKVY